MVRVFSLLGVALLAGLAGAQTLYEHDAFGTLSWDEFTGPPAACGYPTGPLLASFPYQQAAPCVSLNPVPPGSNFGDVTDNMIADRVYVTDGKSVAEFNAATGLQTNVMPVAGVFGTGPLVGLGFNSLANILWITDGVVIMGVTPSAPGSCAAPALAVPPFLHVGPALATDVTWVPSVGLVVACDGGGFVTGYTPAGAIAIPPYFATGICGMAGTALQGIAADTSTGCSGAAPVISISNGLTVARTFLFGGGAAPPTFYQTAVCSPVPLPLSLGLAYSAHPIHYGAGSGPAFKSAGQSCLPSPGFALGVTGGPPSGQAYLIVGLSPACPSLNLLGQPLLVFPISTILGPFPLSAGGTFTLPAPLPAPGGTIPCGLSVYAQWFVKNAANQWRSSEGLEFTFSLP
jgi:hypothetical protein